VDNLGALGCGQCERTKATLVGLHCISTLFTCTERVVVVFLLCVCLFFSTSLCINLLKTNSRSVL